MIGIVVVAHQDLGEAFVRAAEGVVGPMPRVAWMGLRYDETTEQARERLARAIAGVDSGDGVLVLTDMFGGTPTNLSLPFLRAGRVEVLAGVNLPILLKAHGARDEMDLASLASFLRDYGQRNIVLASDIWNARPGE